MLDLRVLDCGIMNNRDVSRVPSRKHLSHMITTSMFLEQI